MWLVVQRMGKRSGWVRTEMVWTFLDLMTELPSKSDDVSFTVYDSWLHGSRVKEKENGPKVEIWKLRKRLWNQSLWNLCWWKRLPSVWVEIRVNRGDWKWAARETEENNQNKTEAKGRVFQGRRTQWVSNGQMLLNVAQTEKHSLHWNRILRLGGWSQMRVGKEWVDYEKIESASVNVLMKFGRGNIQWIQSPGVASRKFVLIIILCWKRLDQEIGLLARELGK